MHKRFLQTDLFRNQEIFETIWECFYVLGPEKK